MAQRRMLSKSITGSARFIKMPVSSQALYFHLNIHADDDGVVEAYPILQMGGFVEDDLKVLASKKFVRILNEDLVAYILDWREHNLIRADRKIDSVYKNLLLQILPDVDLVDSVDRGNSHFKRLQAYRQSELPRNFFDRIRLSFVGDLCPMCIETVMTEKGDKTKVSMQHNKRISAGGQHVITNISVVCMRCNLSVKNIDTGPLNNEKVMRVWAECQQVVRTSSGHLSGNVPLRVGKGRVGKDNIPPTPQIRIEAKDHSDVYEIFEAFRPVNPHYDTLQDSRRQYDAAMHLLQVHGLEAVLKVIAFLPTSNRMKYVTTIITPAQLEEKWATLAAHLYKASPASTAAVAGKEIIT